MSLYFFFEIRDLFNAGLAPGSPEIYDKRGLALQNSFLKVRNLDLPEVLGACEISKQNNHSEQKNFAHPELIVDH
jgi:hypothetical protein